MQLHFCPPSWVLAALQSATLSRSRSSPSPPSSRVPTGRSNLNRRQVQNGRIRKRLNSTSSSTTARPNAESLSGSLDWSTSYQAGSSSSASRSSSDDSETEDELPASDRGRAFSQNGLRNGPNGNWEVNPPSSAPRRRSPQAASSNDSAGSPSGLLNPRVAFTRSRSPVVRPSGGSKTSSRPHRHMSPSLSRASRSRPIWDMVTFFPRMVEFRLKFWPTPWSLSFSADTRKCGESWILMGAVLYAAWSLYSLETFSLESTEWILTELLLLTVFSVLYSLWTHSTLSHLKTIESPPLHDTLSLSPSSKHQQRSETRDPKRNTISPILKNDFGFIWMSVPKNYRESLDDGIFTALLLGPLIASGLLVSALRLTPDPSNILPEGWRIEKPAELLNSHGPYSVHEALVLSRYSLVDLATFCSTILLFHVCASWWLEGRFRKPDTPEEERASVPRSEGLRSWYYIVFTFAVSIGAFGVKAFLQRRGYGIWQHLNYSEIIFASLFYQFTLYIAIRLAHRGFTLGELGLVCFGGTSIFMEFLNITIASIWPVTTPFIKTYRLPTPLLIFQLSLIAGSFLTGFLLAPFLVLSRHIAQRPARRLRFPQDKQRNRRYLALGFYVGTVLIVGGLIGMWTRWCLGKRDPWLWVIFWILEGKRKWSRPALLAYWALLGCLSVAGWNRQLARSRKYKPRNPTGENHIAPGILDTISPQTIDSAMTPAPPTPPPTSGGPLGMSFSNLPALPNLPNGANVTNVATDLLDAADKHVPTLGLNARRKFFHALAVVMFIPGLALDPAFTHLSFSAAFALFTFTEYVRYFAIYPFGAAVHLFMNEFLDHRDGGTAILSHFYLLTGCAGSLWLEGPTQLLQFTGILTLGVGDAMASIVGKRIGGHRWSPSTSKTLEGSMAFTVTIVACAWILRLCGYAESFSSLRYTAVVGVSSVLEALSDQNDNLTLPLFMWSMLVLADV